MIKKYRCFCGYNTIIHKDFYKHTRHCSTNLNTKNHYLHFYLKTLNQQAELIIKKLKRL